MAIEEFVLYRFFEIQRGSWPREEELVSKIGKFLLQNRVAVEIAVVAIGLATSCVFSLSGQDSLGVLGPTLLSLMITLYIEVWYSVHGLDKKLSINTDQIKSVIEPRNDVYNCLLRVVEVESSAKYCNPIEILQVGPVDVSGSNVLDLWLDSTWKFKKRYCAVNYEETSAAYSGEGSFRAQAALDTQNAKAMLDAEVNKIFVVDSLEELKDVRLSKVIKDHMESQVKVRYLLRNNPNLQADLDAAIAAGYSLDFSIFDNYVFAWQLDEERVSQGGRVFFSAENVKWHEMFFSKLLSEASTIRPEMLSPSAGGE